MDISYKQENNIRIVKIGGKLVASNSNDLKTFFQSSLEKTSNFVFDLSEMDFIDSTGLGALVSCLKKAMEASGDIYIANLATKPRLVFEMTRAYKIFTVFDDVKTSMEAFESK